MARMIRASLASSLLLIASLAGLAAQQPARPYDLLISKRRAGED
jgi:hypothetical protein